MSTNQLPSSRTAVLELFAQIQNISNIGHFRDGVVEDEVTYDTDGKVHGYVVLWAGVGAAIMARLCRAPDAKAMVFQVTCVGGDGNRAIWVADKVVSALEGLRLTLPDGITTPITQDELDIAFPQKDSGVNPPRYQLPLVFSCRMAPA